MNQWSGEKVELACYIVVPPIVSVIGELTNCDHDIMPLMNGQASCNFNVSPPASGETNELLGVSI